MFELTCQFFLLKTIPYFKFIIWFIIKKFLLYEIIILIILFLDIVFFFLWIFCWELRFKFSAICWNVSTASRQLMWNHDLKYLNVFLNWLCFVSFSVFCICNTKLCLMERVILILSLWSVSISPSTLSLSWIYFPIFTQC